jgi:hypothetical protein
MQIRHITSVRFPVYTGVRVLMMPFHIHNPEGSLPDYLKEYATQVRKVLMDTKAEGVGYLTVDEAELRPGEYHRRPGKHVDGVGEDGETAAAWGGGGGGGWGSGGMYLASNVVGCRGWDGELSSKPGPDGDCAHVQPSGNEVMMAANQVYWCSPLALHESLPMTAHCVRQMFRLSMPNPSPWYESCTPNPLGIQPTGKILPARDQYMAHRR